MTEDPKRLLDDPAALEGNDPAGMLGLVEEAARQWREMLTATVTPPGEEAWRSVDDVVITGMGGSAIAADYARILLTHTWPVRIHVLRGYRLPAWVDRRTLVVCCSYSGNTEETVSAWHDAGDRAAHRAVLTTGGTIGAEAARAGVPVVTLPDGLPPRAALPSALVGLLRLLGGVGEHTPGGPGSDEMEAALAESADVLDRMRGTCGRQMPTSDNPAKQLAAWLGLALPVIYAPEYPLGPVALRWRGQFAENAKRLAWGHLLPEMNHNEIVGWEAQTSLHEQTRVLFLEDRDQGDRLDVRIRTTVGLVERTGAPVRRLAADGDALLARMIGLTALGDSASVYLAAAWGIDPTPVAKIDHLKSTLVEAGK
jgi:glucose/mannose-6-phosphate isomerase